MFCNFEKSKIITVNVLFCVFALNNLNGSLFVSAKGNWRAATRKWRATSRTSAIAAVSEGAGGWDWPSTTDKLPTEPDSGGYKEHVTQLPSSRLPLWGVRKRNWKSCWEANMVSDYQIVIGPLREVILLRMCLLPVFGFLTFKIKNLLPVGSNHPSWKISLPYPIFDCRNHCLLRIWAGRSHYFVY